jgi:thiamine biosynthesis lipoprotein
VKTFIDSPTAPSSPLQRYKLHGPTMGTRYSAVLYATAQLDEQRLNRDLHAAVAAVDQQMSAWRQNSDLNRLNAAPLQQWLSLPRELMQVLDCALRVSRQSAGAFDIGVGDLVNAWGFGAAHSQPDPARISALQSQPRQLASDVLELDMPNGRVRKQAQLTLDLCGIAKGFGVDQLAGCLDKWGMQNYLVGIDGELRAKGQKPDGQAWAVGLEKPLRGVREVHGVMELSAAAIATSGDYRHWRELHGQTVSHTMSAAAKAPLTDAVASVSVIASHCMLADAWATALMVAGPQAGPALALARGIDALFILRDSAGLREVAVMDGVITAGAVHPANN